ncbi:TrmH family RNA methyltransferase [Planctomicrobium piriforme]|uniref:23S rRNA (Guanosine2251-2'-O)-methyltransferase n=1 Tax=Planctomicrobium piriforme TaxID=1576369 RepID=A0A1I3LYK7_9PLAN|nr:RNA methyltransferase [Planctomicrobium piriforme]SFI89793.1 23S rRNA (guanosine2251-2'-O)-methyltransferase [Planctomicrobium piriforme]
MSSLRLTNPHSVLAALQTRPADVLEIHASPARSNDGWLRVIDEARGRRIPVREPLARESAGRRPNQEGGRVGTTFAVVREQSGIPLKDLFSPDVPRGIWLALDQLQDPHNVGAVFRTAAFFGVKGIMLTVDRSAPLSPAVYDVASGGVEYVPFTLQTNLARGIDVAKENNMWVLGSSEHAEMNIANVDRDRRWLVVIGNEEKGLRRLTLDRCDQVCQIPPVGQVDSLNVSVAAGILMATLSR